MLLLLVLLLTVVGVAIAVAAATRGHDSHAAEATAGYVGNYLQVSL